jgi:hypothetical protein
MDRPLVLLIDEIGMLSGAALQSLLDQLTAGMTVGEPGAFPRSVGLFGLSAPDPRPGRGPGGGTGGGQGGGPGGGPVGGPGGAAAPPGAPSGGPFSLAREIRLPPFSFADIDRLCESGAAQGCPAVDEEAKLRLWDWTAGAPWQVNALMATALDFVLHGDARVPVSAAAVDESAAALLRDTPAHLRGLASLLDDPGVRRACCESLCGGVAGRSPAGGGAALALEQGLLSSGWDGRLRPAGGLCREIVQRALTSHIRPPAGLREACRGEGEGPDMTLLLQEFQRQWRWNGASWRAPLRDIPGAGEKLPLLTFLEASLPEGATLEKGPSAAEGGLLLAVKGRGRTRPLLAVLERPGGPGHLAYFEELSAAMDAAGTPEGWLAYYDLDTAKGPDERLFWKTRSLSSGRAVHVAGL